MVKSVHMNINMMLNELEIIKREARKMRNQSVINYRLDFIVDEIGIMRLEISGDNTYNGKFVFRDVIPGAGIKCENLCHACCFSPTICTRFCTGDEDVPGTQDRLGYFEFDKEKYSNNGGKNGQA
jgi:hypothetical protein